MDLLKALALPGRGGAISIVGAGGKTTLMWRLARELAEKGRSVVASTTTHILPPFPHEADVIVSDGREDTLLSAVGSCRVVCAACPGSEPGRLCAPPGALLQAASRNADFLIVEADGARRKPVKAPADYEPQIFEPSGAVIAVAGLSALGRPLREVCHRFELACALLSVSADEKLTPELLAGMLVSERGQFKNVKNAERFRVLLNQADDDALATLGERTAARILELLPGCRVAVAALNQRRVKGVYACSS